MLQCDLTQPEAQEALRKNCGVLRRTFANLAKAQKRASGQLFKPHILFQAF